MPYIQSDHVIAAKPLSVLGASLDSRSLFKDLTKTPAIYREYQNEAEVLSYLSNANASVQKRIRQGKFPIFIHSGTLNPTTGAFTGGAVTEWWFKNGEENDNLERKDAVNDLQRVTERGRSTDQGLRVATQDGSQTFAPVEIYGVGTNSRIIKVGVWNVNLDMFYVSGDGTVVASVPLLGLERVEVGAGGLQNVANLTPHTRIYFNKPAQGVVTDPDGSAVFYDAFPNSPVECFSINQDGIKTKAPNGVNPRWQFGGEVPAGVQVRVGGALKTLLTENIVVQRITDPLQYNVQVDDNTTILHIDPNIYMPGVLITLPQNPTIGRPIRIVFGGQIPEGQTCVDGVIMAAPAGKELIQLRGHGTALSGDQDEYTPLISNSITKFHRRVF